MDLLVFQDTPVYSIFYLKGTYWQRWVCVLRNDCLLGALVFVVLASDATLFTQTPRPRRVTITRSRLFGAGWIPRRGLGEHNLLGLH